MVMVRAIHDQLDPLEGYRVEIIEGKITVAASACGKHASIIRTIRRAIEPTLAPDEHGVFENITCEEPEVDRYIADLAVWPVEFIDRDEWAFSGAMCLFTAEVTTPQQEERDYAKAAGYARCGIPAYLVVDRAERACTLFTEPEGGRYRELHQTPFGKPVTLPLDTPVTLDTSRFS